MPMEEYRETDLSQALGRVIAMRRAELGLKRNDLRDRSQLSYPYLAELEKGTKRPSQTALAAIAAALELRPSELLERAEALLGGEDLMRTAPRGDASWFYAESSPDAVSAMSAPPRRSGFAATSDDDLRSSIEDIVREVVRDELRKAGIEPAAGKGSRRPR